MKFFCGPAAYFSAFFNLISNDFTAVDKASRCPVKCMSKLYRPEISFNRSEAQDLKGGGIPSKNNGALIVNLERNPLADFTASAVKIEYIGLVVRRLSVMLMRPDKAATTVHGCHCPGDMAVRIREVLARPHSRPQSLRSFWPAAGIESSGSNHFEITKEITEFCPSGFT